MVTSTETSTNLVSLFFSNTFFFFDILFIVFFGLYFIFSLIVYRQIGLMSATVITARKNILLFVALLHAGVSLVVLLIFLKSILG